MNDCRGRESCEVQCCMDERDECTARREVRAAELWAALNIAGLDGDLPDNATVTRVASAYRAAIAAAEARGRAKAVEDKPPDGPVR